MKIEEFKNNQIIGIILKLKFSDDSIKSMSTLIRADKTSIKQLTNVFKECIYARNNDYKNLKATKIIFSYHIFSEDYNYDKDSIISNVNLPVQKQDQTNIKFVNTNSIFNLPLKYADTSTFLTQLKQLNNNITDEKSNSKKYQILFDFITDREMRVKIVLQDDPKVVVYRFTDKIFSKPNLPQHEYLLERTIQSMSHKKYQYIIDTFNSEVLLTTQVLPKPKQGFIDTLKIEDDLEDKDLGRFLTIDIETKSVFNNEKIIDLLPILISSFDINDKICESRFLDKPKYEIENYSYEIEMQNFLLSFLIKKYNGYKIYAHNLSSFDGVFLLNQLIKLSDRINIHVEPLFRDGLLLSIKVRYGYRDDQEKYRFKIEFKDSLLMLLASLEKLSKTFLNETPDLQKIDNKKIMEILLDPNSNNHLNPIFRRRLQKYCEQDCISLSIIIFKFAVLVKNLCNINIHKYITLSSLAFAIFRTKYLKSDNLIAKIQGFVYKDITKAYTGGHTEVYKLYSDKEVHSYDFSSMYPSVMLKHEYPVGTPEMFKGNPLKSGMSLKDLSNRKAFIKCDIYVDPSMERPLYQTHIKMNNQTRTMAATGLFKNQWVYVPELLYYEELTKGLTKILPDSIQEGYLFRSANIFKDYVTDFYKLKSSVTKDDPLYMISKLFLNSLYGRFGLRQELTQHNIMNNYEVEHFLNNDKPVKEIIDIPNSNKTLVISNKNVEEVNLKSAVSIAAAVTAYARMELAPLLVDKELDIFYIDTDSFKCSQKITELERYRHLDHNGLGALKYEYSFTESLYLLPKLYGGIIKDSNISLIKVKGFKEIVDFENLKSVLFDKQNIKLKQQKMYRGWLNSKIELKTTEYTVQLNENKRILDLDNLSTKPYHFESYDPEKINL